MDNPNRTRVDDVSDGYVEFRVFNVRQECLVCDETFNDSESINWLDIWYSHARKICAVRPISSS